jgi:hypothetical protein
MLITLKDGLDGCGLVINWILSETLLIALDMELTDGFQGQ